jgi:hypothetical protein
MILILWVREMRIVDMGVWAVQKGKVRRQRICIKIKNSRVTLTCSRWRRTAMSRILRTSRRATRHYQTQDTSAYSWTKPTLSNKAPPQNSSPPSLYPTPLTASNCNLSSVRQSRSLPKTQRKSSDTKKYPTTLTINSRGREGLRTICRVISRHKI